jgi:hypothetical protein
VNSIIIVPRVRHAPSVRRVGKITEEIPSAKEGRAVRRKTDLASLRSELERIIEKLHLSDLQKEFLRLRWLDQVLWMEARANNAKVRYYILRLTTIVGGVIIPALISVSRGPSEEAIPITSVVFVVSLLVAISAALEGFLRYGEQWRHYRLKVELLKSEGWLFFQLSGRHYRQITSHAKAYPRFAHRVEKWNRLEVGEYITEVARDKGEEDEEEEEVEEEVEVEEEEGEGKKSAHRREGKETADE